MLTKKTNWLVDFYRFLFEMLLSSLFLFQGNFFNPHTVIGVSCWDEMCDRVDQLTLFPYNRGWETQPNSRGENIPIIRIPIKGGRSPIPNIATFDHGTDGISGSYSSSSSPSEKKK